MINKVILNGRFTADPELRQTPAGKFVCNFSVATDRPYNKNREREVDFFNVEAWDDTAVFISRYMHKGQLVEIDGTLTTKRRIDKTTQAVRWDTYVIAKNIQFAPINNSRKNERGQEQSDTNYEFLNQFESIYNDSPVGTETNN